MPGYPTPDGDGPADLMRLTLKTPNLGVPRLQATSSTNLAPSASISTSHVRVSRRVQTSWNGHFQLYRFTGPRRECRPDILRRGSTRTSWSPRRRDSIRGHFTDPGSDALLDGITHHG